jgi:hypothetical protein
MAFGIGREYHKSYVPFLISFSMVNDSIMRRIFF